jgi:hypothetical protein
VLHLLGAEREPEGEGMERLRLLTDGGEITCRLHPSTEGDAAVLWVFGAGDGLGGPASGLHPRLAQRLRHRGVLPLQTVRGFFAGAKKRQGMTSSCWNGSGRSTRTHSTSFYRGLVLN